MKVAKITTYTVEVPIRKELMITSSLGTHAVTRLLLLRLETEGGVTGVGEATVTPRWSGETAWGAQAMIDHYLAPAVLGRRVDDIPGAVKALEGAAWANPFAKSAVEMAMLDAWGKSAGQPVYKLLGGPVRDLHIPIRFSLAAHAPEVTAAAAIRRVVWGHKTIKVKVGFEPKADIDRVWAVRDAIGPNIRLTVDANGGWSVDDAILALNAMQPLNLTLAEQPVRREDLDGMAEVRRRVKVPIMADEGVFTPWDAQQALKKEACDIIAVYPGKNGGISVSKQIVEMAAERNVACAVGSNLELDPGTAAMCHLTVAARNIDSDTYHGDILGPLYHQISVAKNPVHFAEGMVTCPSGPGLGVEVDWELVASLRV